MKKGFFSRQQLVIPLHRIQSVHIEESWLHQLLDLAQVSIDSPGTSKTEIQFTLHKTDAESLRKYVSAHVRQPETNLEEEALLLEKIPANTSTEKILFQLGTNDLVRLGISANHLEAFFILVTFGFSALDNLERAFNFEFSGVLRIISDMAANSTGAALSIVAIIILLIAILISVLRITLRYGRFVMSETENGYRIQSGLINLKEKIIPFSKLQYISWSNNWLRNKLDIYLLKFHSIGEDPTQQKWSIKVPITRPTFIDELLQYYHPALSTEITPIHVQGAYIFRRLLIVGLLPVCIVMPIVLYNFGWPALWLLVWPAYTLLAALLFQKKFQLRVAEEALQVKRGVFGNEHIVLRWNKMQSVSIRQSIYQRKHQLASLRFNTADVYVEIPFIKLEEAELIRDYAIAKIETSYL